MAVSDRDNSILILLTATATALSPLGKNQNRNQFVTLSFGVDPLNWQSFIEITEMACNTNASCSRGHALKPKR